MYTKHARKAVLTSLIVVAGLFSLSGCAYGGSEQSTEPDVTTQAQNQQAASTPQVLEPKEHGTFTQKLPDGNEVLCIWATDNRGGTTATAGLYCLPNYYTYK